MRIIGVAMCIDGGILAHTCNEATGAKLGKISGARLRSQNLGTGYVRDYLALPLIVSEEKQLVLNDRAADSAAELVVPQLRLEFYTIFVESEHAVVYALAPSISSFVGIECVVAQKLIHAAVEPVRTRFGADADYTPLIIAELGRGVLRDQVEFLNSVRGRLVTRLVILVFAVENAVHQILVRLLTIAVDVGTAGIEHVIRLSHSVGIDIGCAGGE